MNEPVEQAFPAPGASRGLAQLSHEASEARERSRRSAERVLEVEQTLAVSQARALSLEQSLEQQQALAGALAERLARADRVMAAMKRSLSWRITAPLRALKPRR